MLDVCIVIQLIYLNPEYVFWKMLHFFVNHILQFSDWTSTIPLIFSRVIWKSPCFGYLYENSGN